MENNCGALDVSGGGDFKDGKKVHCVKNHTPSTSGISLYDTKKESEVLVRNVSKKKKSFMWFGKEPVESMLEVREYK